MSEKMRKGCGRGVDGVTYSCDVACDRCGADDPTTERQTPTGTALQWLCLDCVSEVLPRRGR
jgi:hypothetical protein